MLYEAGNYLPAAYASNLTNVELKRLWSDMFTKLKELSNTTFTSEREDIGDWVCKTHQELGDIWNQLNKKGKKEAKKCKIVS